VSPPQDLEECQGARGFRNKGVLWQDLEECQREGGALDEALQGLRGDALKQAQAAARAAVDALMLSDAPLLFPPGQLALAAMRSGCNKARPPFVCMPSPMVACNGLRTSTL
jgi:hypothetical protein